jgi:hypothetical protein
MNTKNDYSIAVKNKKVWDFYNTNTNVDFEKANLLLVNFMETIFNNMTNDIGNNINSQLLSFMKESQSQIENMTECVNTVNKNVNTLSSDINTKISLQMNTIKSDYIREFTNIINTSSLSSNEKISTLIDRSNNVLVDKTTLLLSDIIPKNNSSVDTIIKENMKHLQEAITSDTHKLTPHINNQDAQQEFLSKIESKLSNIIQNIQLPLYSTLNASEERLTTNINMIKDTTNNSLVSQNKLFGELEGFFGKCESSTQKDKHGEDAQQEFLSTIENKLSNIIQNSQLPLYSTLNASEERMTTNINMIKDTTNNSVVSQNKLFGELEGFLGKYKSSTQKGKLAEEALSTLLHSIYNSAEITNTTGSKASGDFIMRRTDKPDVMIENKEYNDNIPKEEVSKFIRDIDSLNMSGIFISQHSGITFKQNFQIDINKGNVLVYIQKCEYNPEYIRIAVDIIDNLSPKLNDISTDDDSCSISKEILDDINGDYHSFISQKESMQTLLKDFTKRMNTQIEELALPSLDKYLEPKYAYVKDRFFKCDMCNDFNGKSKQALSAHKRGCKKKHSHNTLLAIDTDE